MSINTILEYYNTQIRIGHNAIAAENITAAHFGISLAEVRALIN